MHPELLYGHKKSEGEINKLFREFAGVGPDRNPLVLNQTEMVEALYSVSNRIVSDAIVYADRQAGYIWTHGGHTGSPVGLYVKGAGAIEFMAVTDNSMIPLTIKKVANY